MHYPNEKKNYIVSTSQIFINIILKIVIIKIKYF